jgi:hypothetical protein
MSDAPHDVPLNRKDLETSGLNAKETVEYVREQLIRCLNATDDPDADVEGIKERYRSLAEKLRRAADQLD